MKWCSGLCGRELPLEWFDPKPGGYRQSECRACRRIKTRERNRRRYRRDGEYREQCRAAAKSRYWSNPEHRRSQVAARTARLKVTQ
jgi:hypothetical protein